MPDRIERILRIACWTLAALVFLRLVQAGFQVGQLVGVKIPAVPTLEVSSNSTAAGASSGSKMQTTNASASTNRQASMAATNAVAAEKNHGTNSVATNTVAQTATTNHLAISTNMVAGGTALAATNHQLLAISSNSMTAEKNIGTNSVATNAVAQVVTTNHPIPVSTNLVATGNASGGATNVPVALASTNHVVSGTSLGTNVVSTNALAQAGTNRPSVAGTNSVLAGAGKPAGTNSPPPNAMPGGGPPMMPGMPGMPAAAPPLPPEIQARVDKIVNSEIFGPVMHPLPMALLGIAGDTAFLRTSSGQTGLVKVGDSLGDLKLLQIGTNRVLVEQEGQKEQLLMFDGYGGDSLLSTPEQISK
jgi:hypothetical protein